MEERYARELHGIKGPQDHRVTVAAAEYPWSAVGRLNDGQGGHCSGVLVGKRLVATAAHCLFNARTQRPMPASAYTFVAGYERGEYLKAAKVVQIHPAPGWVFTSAPKDLAARADDWALLELDQDIGSDVGWVALAPPEPGMAVAVVGYGKDRAFVPRAHIGCHLTERLAGGIYLHDCDAVQGESGGPVLAWQNGQGGKLGQVRLVAINVAVIISRGEAGVAVGIGALRAEADRLGAAPASLPGTLSQPSSLDLGAALSTPR
jgi:protease YdgD